MPFSSSQRQLRLLTFYLRFTFALNLVSYICRHYATCFYHFTVSIVRFVCFVQNHIVYFVILPTSLFVFFMPPGSLPDQQTLLPRNSKLPHSVSSIAYSPMGRMALYFPCPKSSVRTTGMLCFCPIRRRISSRIGQCCSE